MALLIGLLVWANGFLMIYGRDIPFHGLLMPTAASFAALMGGTRWGWWVLAVTSATWLVPWAMHVADCSRRSRSPRRPVLRIWFLHASLTAGLVATIGHVTRHLEAAMERRDTLLERVRTEARAVQALAGRVREAEEGERRRLARELHDDFGQRLTALRMKLQLSRLGPTSAPLQSTTASPSPRSCCRTSGRSRAACGRRCSTRSASGRRCRR